MVGKSFHPLVAVLALLMILAFPSPFASAEGEEDFQEPTTYLMIGDRRFVGMQTTATADPNVFWLDQVGAGSDLYFQYQELVENCDRDTVIVYNLGVNDLNAQQAITALNALSSLGFRHVWFSTLGPVNEEIGASYGYTITNEQIIQFNEQVAANVPANVGVVDSFYYLWYNGFNTLDGIHYDGPTYSSWYRYLMSSVF